MGLHNFDAEMPHDFGNQVRLFPLPNLVLFPSIVQALHIFEPRYCEMLQASLEHDGLIAMALLQPGWEVKYAGRPPIAEVVCIGKIVSHAPTQDHRHNILLAGLKRARILEEDPMLYSYRTAQVELIDDHYPASGAGFRETARKSLSEVLLRGLSHSQAQNAAANLLSQHLPLGVLADIIAYSTRLPISVKQQLLEEVDVDKRCHILLDNLKSLDHKSSFESTPFITNQRKRSENIDPGFPPPFSDN